MELGELVERRAEPRLARRIGEPLAGAVRLVQRGAPVAMQLQDLGATQQTLPAVGHQIGLAVAPPGQRRRPLLRPAPVEHLLAAGDHAAVHIAGREGRHFAGGDRHHRLVEQLQARSSAPQPDQGPALAMPCQGDQVGVAELLPGLGGQPERAGGALVVALGHRPQRLGQQQVSPLHAVLPTLVEQPSRPREPSAGLGRLAFVEQPVREPEGRPGRCRRLVAVVKSVVRPAPEAGALRLPAGQVRGGRQPREIFGLERRLPIGGDEVSVDGGGVHAGGRLGHGAI